MDESTITAIDALEKLKAGNGRFVNGGAGCGDASAARRMQTADQGQHPFALVLTCSDSRVPPEHIFDAGLGDLFVVRTAGNVVGDYELGSIEYGVEHLGIPLVVVMGHTRCGAVAAALADGEAQGCTAKIVEHIRHVAAGETDPDACMRKNTHDSAEDVRACEALRNVPVLEAVYNIETGVVEFIDSL